MTRIVIIPPSPAIQAGVDEVLSAAIAAGNEYRDWTVEEIVADILPATTEQGILDGVAYIIRRDHGKARVGK